MVQYNLVRNLDQFCDLLTGDVPIQRPLGHSLILRSQELGLEGREDWRGGIKNWKKMHQRKSYEKKIYQRERERET